MAGNYSKGCTNCAVVSNYTFPATTLATNQFVAFSAGVYGVFTTTTNANYTVITLPGTYTPTASSTVSLFQSQQKFYQISVIGTLVVTTSATISIFSQTSSYVEYSCISVSLTTLSLATGAIMSFL